MIQIPLTQAEFDTKAAAVKAATGVAVSGANGAIAYDGVTALWAYDGTTLTVTVQHKPIYLPMGTVEGKIRGWFSA